MGCWSARKAQRLNKRLMLGRGRRIAKSLRPGMKGSLDFKPCTTLDQRRGSAERCTTLRTCTMRPIVECGICSAWLKETMCESTAPRRSKRLNECLGEASRLRGHEPDFEIPTLQGDVHLVPPPSILVDVLKHCGKYVPFPTLPPFVARTSKMLRKEVDELERVLIWSTHFVSKKTQDTSKRPSLLEFPYKKLFASTGSSPSYTIKQSLGHKFHVIQ